MLREALLLIQETAQKAQAAAIMPALSGDGRKVFVQQGDQIHEFPLAPPLRRHKVHSLTDLILYARHQENPNPIVWHGAAGVTLLIDDADRRDIVVFPLTTSKRFETMQKLVSDKPALDQARFIRLLRVDLGMDNLKVVAQFRKLNFASGNEGTSEVGHGNDRLGKAISARVQGIEELPDELDVSIPVYRETGERQEYIIHCAIEIDSINRVFQLVPLPDELERVRDLAQASIRCRLIAALGDVDGQKAIPIYYGEP